MVKMPRLVLFMTLLVTLITAVHGRNLEMVDYVDRDSNMWYDDDSSPTQCSGELEKSKMAWKNCVFKILCEHGDGGIFCDCNLPP